LAQQKAGIAHHFFMARRLVFWREDQAAIILGSRSETGDELCTLISSNLLNLSY
jgi:hypothetical protein